MTPAQLEHLKLIDAHLERLLAIAKKRTPGEWSHGETTPTFIGGKVWSTVGQWCVLEPEYKQNAAFIASCASNAEAGWRATRAAIEFLLLQEELGEEFRFGHLLTDILAAFPLEALK